MCLTCAFWFVYITEKNEMFATDSVVIVSIASGVDRFVGRALALSQLNAFLVALLSLNLIWCFFFFSFSSGLLVQFMLVCDFLFGPDACAKTMS